jgi:hypothetical protein
VTIDVSDQHRPILLVSNDEEGDWGFSSTLGFDGPDSEMNLFHLDWVVRGHPYVAELADLPRGWAARRAGEGMPWVRFHEPPEP